MNTNLMSRIRISGFVCLAITLGLAGISYADLPQVIGNWEDSNDDWMVHSEAADGTTAKAVQGNATLGNYSLQGVCAFRLAESNSAGFVGRSETAGGPRKSHTVKGRCNVESQGVEHRHRLGQGN